MADSFQLFRLSLLPRPQRDAFAGPDPTREEYLTKVFSERRVFEHYASEFHFIPDAKRSAPGALLARLGRPVTVDENRPPDEELEEVSHQGWKAAVIAIDPRDTPDGQKAAIEVDRAVGAPAGLIVALAKAINAANPLAPYTIEAEPIIDSNDFWEFAAANKGAITTLTFEFIVPNGLWSARTNIKEELRAVKEHIGAQKVINTFKSEDGLDTNDSRIKEAVEYAASGSGEIRAKARKMKRFSSRTRPKTAILEITGDEVEPVIVRVARQIAKVFDRE